MLTINYTLFIQIANFLFLILLLNVIVFRPIRNILNKRKEEISSSENKTQACMRQTEKYSEELEANISSTRKEGFKNRDALKCEGMEDEDKMLKETYSLVEKKINKARLELEEKTLQARDSLHAEVKSFSTDLAEKFLGRGI